MQKFNALLLAAGIGSRLGHLTDFWPKCLMPINGKPLLALWLETLESLNIKNVFINTHYLSNHVTKFLHSNNYGMDINILQEDKLHGTAGTISKNFDNLKNSPLLLIHADNLCHCNFRDFLKFHEFERPSESKITMMTFDSPSPKNCGIVKINELGIVKEFHEKVRNPPSNLANAAVYIIEPKVISWIRSVENISDFSIEVLPQYIGEIATWHNTTVHRDIGSPRELVLAQSDLSKDLCKTPNNAWFTGFKTNPIHKLIADLVEKRI